MKENCIPENREPRQLHLSSRTKIEKEDEKSLLTSMKPIFQQRPDHHPNYRSYPSFRQPSRARQHKSRQGPIRPQRACP
jgi:hypothetical protein